MDLNAKLIARVSATVSGLDGVTHDVMQQPGASAFLGTLAEAYQKLMSKIDSPSATLVSGGSVAAVALNMNATDGASGIYGHFQGWPFRISAAGHLSGSPTSLISTASTTVRKVLVTLALSNLPVASSIALDAGTVQFVYGSAYDVTASSVLSGGVSATFNKVPLPKASAGEIPVGWLNVPNSHATSAGIADHMLITDYRETQGFDFSAIMAINQP
jgi:hypothetical protein